MFPIFCRLHRPSLIFLLLAYMLDITSCDQIPCSNYVPGEDHTLCHAFQEFEDRESEYKQLSAAGRRKIQSQIFPPKKDFQEALVQYDGSLYPVPIGPSIYFLTFTALLICWYLTACSRYWFENTKNKLQLHPVTAKFPNIPLYWLQQSKRETSLKREVRNTWAWLARRYLLSPDDPLLDGIGDVLGVVTWDDFYVPRDTWSLLNVILKVNELYLKVKRDKKGQSSFSILRDETGTHDPFENVPLDLLPEGFLEEVGPEDVEEDQPGILMYDRVSIMRPSVEQQHFNDYSRNHYHLSEQGYDFGADHDHFRHRHHTSESEDSDANKRNMVETVAAPDMVPGLLRSPSASDPAVPRTHTHRPKPESKKKLKWKKKLAARGTTDVSKPPLPRVPKQSPGHSKPKTEFKFRKPKADLFATEDNPLQDFEPVSEVPTGFTDTEDKEDDQDQKKDTVEEVKPRKQESKHHHPHHHHHHHSRTILQPNPDHQMTQSAVSISVEVDYFNPQGHGMERYAGSTEHGHRSRSRNTSPQTQDRQPQESQAGTYYFDRNLQQRTASGTLVPPSASDAPRVQIIRDRHRGIHVDFSRPSGLEYDDDPRYMMFVYEQDDGGFVVEMKVPPPKKSKSKHTKSKHRL